MAAAEGEIRVRQRRLVAVELAVIGAACFALPMVMVLSEWARALWFVAIAAVLGLAVPEPAFVADGAGIRFSSWWAPWRRHRLSWDEVYAVRLVSGSFARPGRRMEVGTARGWIELGAPRDGWLVRDRRLEDLVERLWRQVPPRGPALPAT